MTTFHHFFFRDALPSSTLESILYLLMLVTPFVLLILVVIILSFRYSLDQFFFFLHTVWLWFFPITTISSVNVKLFNHLPSMFNQVHSNGEQVSPCFILFFYYYHSFFLSDLDYYLAFSINIFSHLNILLFYSQYFDCIYY